MLLVPESGSTVRSTEPTAPAGYADRQAGMPLASGMDGLLGRLDQRIRSGLTWCTADARRATAALLLLCLALFVPGALSRPPVDRTEVVYAQAARQMLERGDPITPRDSHGNITAGRPIGIVWLQALAARTFGPETHDAIWAYRLPSLLGATLAVLFLYLGLRTEIGGATAFCAAAMLAASLLLAVHSRLALPQAATLAAAIAAQTSLARVYLGRQRAPDQLRWASALIFGAALGVGVLLNSMILPVLAALTLVGLALQDRTLRWIAKPDMAVAALVALVLATPAFVSLALSAVNEPPEGRSLLEWISLIIDPQSMKYRAFPGSYLLTVWLGLLPCMLFLLAAVQLIWSHRTLPLMRFLLAWLIPYLAVMELVSHKPPLYMIQYVLPVLAIGAALRITDNPVTGAPRPLVVGSPLLVSWAVFGLCLAAIPIALHVWFEEPVTPLTAIAALAVAAGFAATAWAMRHRQLLAAMSLSLASAACLYWLVLALLFPPSSMMWPAVRMAELSKALRPCYPDAPVVAGYSEPSVAFLLGPDTAFARGWGAALYLEANPRSFALVDESSLSGFMDGVKASSARPPIEIACASGRNPFTTREATLRVFVREPRPADASCTVPARYQCPPANPRR